MNKKILLTVLLVCGIYTTSFAQAWYPTQSGGLAVYPDTIKIGIGTSAPTESLHLVEGAIRLGRKPSIPGIFPPTWTAPAIKFGNSNNIQIGLLGSSFTSTTLMFQAPKFGFLTGNVGIGTSAPQYKLDVNGKLFLRTVSTENGWAQSFLQWPGHKLIMGSPAGNNSHVLLELMPGGVDNSVNFSSFTMYTATGANVQTAKVQFTTTDHCWFNNDGYVGIGTSSPTHKLDVRGTIRANEVIVNIPSGADFVFSPDYSLKPLSEIRDYIAENQHLPEIPSAEEMEAGGVSISELQIQLLQKIEELTLYILQQEQRINEVEKRVK